MHFSFGIRRLLAGLPIALIALLPAACDSQPEEADPPDTPAAWMTIESPEPPMQRHENGYVEAGGRFYLLGGRGQRPVQVFDPATNGWTTRGAPPFEMHHFQAVEYDGMIYVLGAFTGGFPFETPVPNVYIYDPASDVWTEGPAIPEDRRRGAAGVVVHNDEFYVVCGIRNGHYDGYVAWLDAFDPKTGQWRRLPDAPRPRDHFHAVVLDGKLYAAGGRRSSHATGEVFQLTIPEVDVYDFATGEWSTLPPAANLPTERAGTAAVAFEGNLAVLGGESGRHLTDGSGGGETPPPAHDDFEVFDPATSTWTAMPPMIQGRHGTQAIVYEGKIYIAAGSRTLGGTEINSQEVFIRASQ